MITDQKQHWNEIYSRNAEFFGEEPSDFAKQALAQFRENGVSELLELGPGQGRDTIYFAENGLAIKGLDYSSQSISELNAKVEGRSIASRIKLQAHDIREPFPFPDSSFDACYAHMLLCMHFKENDIKSALAEIHRVIRPGGLAVYSVRSTFDPHYKHPEATYLGEKLYELGGFVVHFFSEAMIRKFARGFKIVNIGRLKEGGLPRDLFVVVLKKAGPIEGTDVEGNMSDAFGLYQDFFDAAYGPGILDKKTKSLIAVGASLAAGCET